MKTAWSPATTFCVTRQSTQASAASRIGAPVISARYATPRNLSSIPQVENRRERDSPRPSSRMFTAKIPERSIQLNESASSSTHTRTRGGDSDSEANALTVSPHGRPSWCNDVTTVTPVGKCPITRRNSLSSIIWPASSCRCIFDISLVRQLCASSMHVAVHVIAGVMLLVAAPTRLLAQEVVKSPPIPPAIQPAVERPARAAPAPQAQERNEPRPDLWSFAAEFSFTDQSGNKTLRLLTGGLKFSHRDKERFELDGSIQSRYGQSEGEVVARNYYGSINFSPYKNARIAPSFSVKAERDPFKRLDVRFVGSAGAKVTPYREEGGNGELAFYLMTSYEFQNLQVEPGDDEEEFSHVPR